MADYEDAGSDFFVGHGVFGKGCGGLKLVAGLSEGRRKRAGLWWLMFVVAGSPDVLGGSDGQLGGGYVMVGLFCCR